MRLVRRLIWLSVGLTAVALAAIGVVLPLLPTTPFLLVAAFAFARSSNRLQAWLLNHGLFGALIDNWRRYGAISRSAKTTAVLSMAAVFALSIVLAVSPIVLLIQGIVLVACVVFILSRPTPPVA
ncbi:MAG: YbaN family protein [Pseudomonadota bacterium]